MSTRKNTPEILPATKRSVDVDCLLTALQDDDCQQILEAVETTAMSASELAETCDLPLSTTYRKLDHLTDAALLEERLRVSTTGSHEREYAPESGELTITVGAGGAVTVETNESDGHRETPLVAHGD